MVVADYCTGGSAATCPELHADVLKIPHHGSANFDPEFFTAVGATWGVISAGYKNRKHCLPRTDPIDALHALGTKIISTSADGDENVVLTTTSGGVMAWSWPATDFFAWAKSAGTACSEEMFVEGQ